MDSSSQPGKVTNLLDYEGQLVAKMIHQFREVTLAATARVSNRSTVGEAAANRLRMEAEAAGLIRTAEDLLSLTRRVRELWMIGPLRKPGEGDAEAETRIRGEVEPVAAALDAARMQQRQRLLGAHGTYHSTTATTATTAPEEGAAAGAVATTTAGTGEAATTAAPAAPAPAPAPAVTESEAGTQPAQPAQPGLSAVP